MYNNLNCNSKILVIGDLMIDHYIYGNCDRISLEAPIPVVEITREKRTLGGAGNVLKNLKAFGCTTTIISVTGDDENAAIVEMMLQADGFVFDGLVKDASRCTTIKSRVLAVNHQLIRLDREVTESISSQVEQAVVTKVRDIIDSYEVVLISDYNKGLLTASLVQAVVSICQQSSKIVLVDPKGLDFSKYKGVNLIKPNKKEAGLATGIAIKDKDSLEQACKRIKEITNCNDVVVTMSDEGIALFSDAGLNVIPTKALDVIDVTGAGDTVLASLGLALCSGKSLYEACVFANQAAAVVVSKVGSATATLDEIEQRFNR
ncbi:D-glycero-beta-D-manno-heptose-7-phosphate kinase [Mucilaginibacter sp. PAMB04168]|uniref:D-glycero-beta-D-manno-heptose-7-phosphate kinase n=1 Tax=Mucilaginibacter sp. PAMB04168 TaxID=3138567 RepID=UPI0033321D37